MTFAVGYSGRPRPARPSPLARVAERPPLERRWRALLVVGGLAAAFALVDDFAARAEVASHARYGEAKALYVPAAPLDLGRMLQGKAA